MPYDPDDWERRLDLARAKREEVLRKRAEEGQRIVERRPVASSVDEDEDERRPPIAPRLVPSQSVDLREDARPPRLAGAIRATGPLRAPVRVPQGASGPERSGARTRPMLLGLVVGCVAGVVLAGLAATTFGLVRPQGQDVLSSALSAPQVAGPVLSVIPVEISPMSPAMSQGPDTSPSSTPAVGRSPAIAALTVPSTQRSATFASVEPARAAAMPRITASPPVMSSLTLPMSSEPGTAPSPIPAVERSAAIAALPAPSARRVAPPASSAPTDPVSLPPIAVGPPVLAQPSVAANGRPPELGADAAGLDTGRFLAATPSALVPPEPMPVALAIQETARPTLALTSLPEPPARPADTRISRVAVHAPVGLPPDRMEGVLARIAEIGWPILSVTTPHAISGSHIRYFHAGDRVAAQELAAVLGYTARDFTSFSPPPSPGSIEVWLGGDGGPSPVVPVQRPASAASAAVPDEARAFVPYDPVAAGPPIGPATPAVPGDAGLTASDAPVAPVAEPSAWNQRRLERWLEQRSGFDPGGAEGDGGGAVAGAQVPVPPGQ